MMHLLALPLDLTGASFLIVNLLIGIGFGVALDRSGFGDSRRIAAQFYLTDLTVLKVMFTAIVTAMILLLWSNALGILDLSEIYIDETWLSSGVIGGFLLGIGMVVGGYCPGTSLVATSSLKVDGLFFVGGLFLGILVFGETVPAFWDFFEQSGYMGRYTLDEWLGTSVGMTAILVSLMALASFWGAERLRVIRGQEAPRRFNPFTNPRALGASVALLFSFGLLVVPQPDLASRLLRQDTSLQAILDSRDVQLDPGELLELMHNNQVSLELLDVRDEADFNMFHLLDARHVSQGDLRGDMPKTIPGDMLVVVMSNDEALAAKAWKILRVQRVLNSYILEGGINKWLEVYGPYADVKPKPVSSGKQAEEKMRFLFPAALGDRVDISWPDPHHMHLPERRYKKKAKAAKTLVTSGGGCG